MITPTVRKALAAAARHAVLRSNGETLGRYTPDPGDMVVEMTGMVRPVNPESLAILVAHGHAPLNLDGTGPSREVWDVRPIGKVHAAVTRWENAEFVRVPAWFRDLVRSLCGQTSGI